MRGLPLTTLLAASLAMLSHAQTPVGSPNLFFNLEDLPQIKERIASSEWLSSVFEWATVEADDYLNTTTQPYSLTTPSVDGFRGNGIGSAGRAVGHRLATLAMVGYVKDEQKYLDKGVEILLAVVRQTSPDTHQSWIKHLQTGDATQSVAIGYDLYGHLLSPSEHTEVGDYLERIGQYLVDQDTGWGSPAPGVISCNHNSVHYGALGLAALALGEREAWLDIARARVRGFFEHFMDDTGYPTEGHQYYSYGLTGAYPFSYALERATGEELWDSQPNLHLVGGNLVWKLLPFDGRMVAMNDNNEATADPTGIVPALVSNNGVQLWAWLQGLTKSEEGLIKGNGQLAASHGTFLLYLVGDKPTQPVNPADIGYPLGHRFESGRVFLRNSWADETAAHVSFTSGYDFHRGHNHHDENNLTFAALGEAFLIDPGYAPKWAEQHSILTVNGAGQITGGRGRLVAYREDELGAYVRGQAEEAYDFETAVVAMADRQAYFVRGPQPYLAWRDDMATEDDNPAHFISRYITDRKNQLTQKGDAVQIDGYRGKASCMLYAFAEGKQVKVVAEDLKGKTFVRSGRDEPYPNHLKRAYTEFVGNNPRLVSLAIPFHEEKDLPEIEVDYNKAANEVTCALRFPDGYTDTLVFGLGEVTFSRR